MWCWYSGEHWPISYDVRTAVLRIQARLEAVNFDMRHATVYDTNICFDQDAVNTLLKEADDCCSGVTWCTSFLNDSIDLDRFCAEMEKLNLHQYLFELESFAPADIVAKYGLGMDDEEISTSSQDS